MLPQGFHLRGGHGTGFGQRFPCRWARASQSGFSPNQAVNMADLAPRP